MAKQGKSRAKKPAKKKTNVPPVEHRFKPGQSGNPKGRKPGQSIGSILRQIAAEDDEAIRTALAQVALRKALRGGPDGLHQCQTIGLRIQQVLALKIGSAHV